MNLVESNLNDLESYLFSIKVYLAKVTNNDLAKKILERIDDFGALN